MDRFLVTVLGGLLVWNTKMLFNISKLSNANAFEIKNIKSYLKKNKK